MCMNNIKLKVGFIGAGAMATALAKGFIESNLVHVDDVKAYDINVVSSQSFTKSTGAETMDSVERLIEFADVVVLAVKPIHVTSVVDSIRHINKCFLLISIAAGIATSMIECGVNKNVRVVRVMPNTPALVGCGASAFCLGKTALEKDCQITKKLLSAIGISYQVPENQMDAVTGLSGSGPAFVYMIIEAMSDGGVAAGLSRNISTNLAAQTVLGAAKMVLETGLHPGELKDHVTSPAGTTIAGVQKLEDAGVRAAFIQAVRAATERSCEMRKQQNNN